ncbi:MULTISPECIES: hypothetical protein [Streptomyces]|uniref:Integral membrane protein n=1 Tax=Streptomyces californicus TaxID=67351 RepID=A0ABD7CWF6_9ACTN|nr:MULTISPECIES: hypothetical protein [Streptomyces]KOU05483.1 membrane protein [Streptomyces sp. NRRL F-2295]MBD3548197.1 hypothetical protein [Streptomyces sp. JV180]MBD3556096.1 hypothetical protein [Streptomyces sp. SP18CM02]QRV29780.1 hypothetical protein I6J39_22630 [Streptomyces californicus]QRV34612.1 hypothetical protein I6J42_11445 [Streptomyces californicus]
MRRGVAIVTALVLFGEAVGIVLINAVLATITENQNMSLAGMDPEAMTTGTWVMGGVSGLLLALCGVIALLAGVRDRSPGRLGRIVLIGCAVVHGVLGAVTVGLIGWSAFAFMMAVLALLVLTLLAYGPEAPADGDRAGEEPAPAAV